MAPTRLMLFVLIGSVTALGCEQRADDSVAGLQCTLASVESHQITSNTSDYFSTPRLGEGATGWYLVYARYRGGGGGTFSEGEIVFQTLHVDGSAIPGGETEISGPIVDEDGTLFIADNRSPDASGDHIVFTAFRGSASAEGAVMLFDLATGQRTRLTDFGPVHEARVHEGVVAWIEGQNGTTTVKFIDLNGSTPSVQTIGGPLPPATKVEVGDRYIVWNVGNPGTGSDVVAYELATGASFSVTNDPDVMQRRASTSGDWVVYEALDLLTGTVDIEAQNLATGDKRTVASDVDPSTLSIDGDHVLYGFDDGGGTDLAIVALSNNDTHELGVGGVNEAVLGHNSGDLVTWIGVSAEVDVWTARVDVFDPCDGADADGDCVCDDVDPCPTDPDDLCTQCPGVVALDFELDSAGQPISAGAVVGAQLVGVVVSATNGRSGHPDLPIVFDTASVTGGDTDLATPGYGPGNDSALGNVLIIAENDGDGDGDGLIDDPDDEASGGTLRLQFDGPVTVHEITLLDVDQNEVGGSSVQCQAGGTMTSVAIPALADNGVQTLSIGASEVDSMEINLVGSGALARVVFEPVCSQ